MSDRPTIHELEAILDEPAGDIEILPSGEVVVKSVLAKLRAENERLREAQAIVNMQAEDTLLWAFPLDECLQTIQEVHLQQALRRLHEAIEGKTLEECAAEVLKEPDDA